VAKKVIWLFHHYADPPDGHWTNHFDLFEEVSVLTRYERIV
jgi:hypothetical protein